MNRIASAQSNLEYSFTPLGLPARFQQVRLTTEGLCKPLEAEDYVVQSMPDASPVKWHLAHTTWFFETFVLRPNVPGYRAFHPLFGYLFNSYYVSVGERYNRPDRGLLSRPTVREVYQYRRHVDEEMLSWLARHAPDVPESVAGLIELGLHHEQQHQELILTDVKHALGINPLRPAYRPVPKPGQSGPASPLEWVSFDEELAWVGHDGPSFAYDNERPRHRVFLEACQLASRPVNNGEYRLFIEDGGYQTPTLWLSEGWATVERERWTSPLYWEHHEGGWLYYTLGGMRLVADAEPVCHISYFEADAFARWAGARLPTEFEWEAAARRASAEGDFSESGRCHPSSDSQAVAATATTGAVASQRSRLHRMFGDVWEWTRSQYLPYPGYAPPPGAVGEYNGKFMCNQFVLRGGSCATPRSHIRASYRNFFPPAARWQFSGVRLARDA